MVATQPLIAQHRFLLEPKGPSGGSFSSPVHGLDTFGTLEAFLQKTGLRVAGLRRQARAWGRAGCRGGSRGPGSAVWAPL